MSITGNDSGEVRKVRKGYFIYGSEVLSRSISSPTEFQAGIVASGWWSGYTLAPWHIKCLELEESEKTAEARRVTLTSPSLALLP